MKTARKERLTKIKKYLGSILTTYDDGMLREIVETIKVINQKELEFQLIGGINIIKNTLKP